MVADARGNGLGWELVRVVAPRVFTGLTALGLPIFREVVVAGSHFPAGLVLVLRNEHGLARIFAAVCPFPEAHHLHLPHIPGVPPFFESRLGCPPPHNDGHEIRVVFPRRHRLAPVHEGQVVGRPVEKVHQLPVRVLHHVYVDGRSLHGPIRGPGARCLRNVGFLVGARLAEAAVRGDSLDRWDVGDPGEEGRGLEGGGESSGEEEELGPDVLLPVLFRQLPTRRIERDVEVLAERRGVVGVAGAELRAVFGVGDGALEVLCNLVIDERTIGDALESVGDDLEREPSEASEDSLLAKRVDKGNGSVECGGGGAK